MPGPEDEKFMSHPAVRPPESTPPRPSETTQNLINKMLPKEREAFFRFLGEGMRPAERTKEQREVVAKRFGVDVAEVERAWRELPTE